MHARRRLPSQGKEAVMMTDENPDDLSKGRHALVLGGGAPTLTLMAGALLALDEEGVEFDLVSTSGAGMLVGLLYAAPKDGDRRKALRATVDLGVHDAIYRNFPVNFKVFFKPGPLAEAYYKAMAPLVRMMPRDTDTQRLAHDLFAMWVATWSPSDLTPQSLGMCSAAPWLEEVVDFEALKRFGPEFYINAWNIRERQMRVFDKAKITPAHFRAALAFPLIYPPFELDGDHYIEGSAMDTLNLEGLLEYDSHYDRAYPGMLKAELASRWPAIQASAQSADRTALETLIDQAEWAAHAAALRARVRKAGKAPEDAAPAVDEADMRKIPEVARALDYEKKAGGEINAISKIVVFDVLGTDRLVRKPRSLYDAWVLQMIVPLVSISNDNIRMFEKDYDYPAGDPKKYLHRLQFDDQISHDHWPQVLDWSYSNLKTLFDAGYRAGKAFYSQHDWLRARADAGQKIDPNWKGMMPAERQKALEADRKRRAGARV
jgi:predicted acylesterase/phospholipase RssA